jgi:hypothetical protein
MPTKRIHISAVTVQCSEAIDWEIVQVTFDTEASDFDEENRTSEYLLLSANFEFGNDVQIEFDLRFDLSDDAFCELREHLKVLLRYDSFRA